jgi:hypothetical protein
MFYIQKRQQKQTFSPTTNFPMAAANVGKASLFDTHKNEFN